MPTYRYICDSCNTHFEKFVPFHQGSDKVACPEGHRDIRRLFTPPAIVFKGKGFYITDSRPASKKSAPAD